MTSVSQDLRHSLRMLLKEKGFTIVSVLTLALGIGINTAMFSVLNTFIFGSLPYPQSDQLVSVHRTSPHSQSWPFSAANFFDQHDQNTVFEKMAAYVYLSRNLSEPGQTAERLREPSVIPHFTPVGADQIAVHQQIVGVENPRRLGARQVVLVRDTGRVRAACVAEVRLWRTRVSVDRNTAAVTNGTIRRRVDVLSRHPPAQRHPVHFDRPE